MPLSTIHLENMLALSRMGVAMVPPMPAFYNLPQTVDDIIQHIVARVLDGFGLEHTRARRQQDCDGQIFTGEWIMAFDDFAQFYMRWIAQGQLLKISGSECGAGSRRRCQRNRTHRRWRAAAVV